MYALWTFFQPHKSSWAILVHLVIYVSLNKLPYELSNPRFQSHGFQPQGRIDFLSRRVLLGKVQRAYWKIPWIRQKQLCRNYMLITENKVHYSSQTIKLTGLDLRTQSQEDQRKILNSALPTVLSPSSKSSRLTTFSESQPAERHSLKWTIGL